MYDQMTANVVAEIAAMRKECDALRKDAERWRYVVRHWKKAHMDWNKDACNTPRSLVLEMNCSVTAISGWQIESFIDEAIVAGKAVLHNAEAEQPARAKDTR